MSNALWPFLEDNQGLLSLAALAAALSLAWVEMRRANRAEASRITDPADAAIELVDEAIRLTELGIGDEATAHQAASYADRALPALNLIAAGSIPSGKLVLKILALRNNIETLARTPITHHLEDSARRAAIFGQLLQRLKIERHLTSKIAAEHAGGKRLKLFQRTAPLD